MTNRGHGQGRQMQGYTLVEVLVASTIIAISVISLVLLLRKGREIETVSIHRRAAHRIADSLLEMPRFTPTGYNLLGPSNDSFQTVLQERSGGDVIASVRTSIGNEATCSGVPCKKIHLNISWEEPEGAESLAIARWMAKAE